MDNKTLVDLIRRADAIKAEADRVYEALHFAGCRETYEECLADAEKTFKDVPSFELKYEITADQLAKLLREGWTISEEPKQGEWIPKEMWTEGVGMGEQYGRYYECSECHREYRGDMESCHNFCPNCGADMRKRSE